MPKFGYWTLDGDALLDSDSGILRMSGQTCQLSGAQAYVQNAGEIEKRVTFTRVALTGPFAFAWQKRSDRRELYLVVDAPTMAMVARLHPSEGTNARRFAAAVNTVARGGQLTELMLVPPSGEARAATGYAQKEREISEMTSEQRVKYAKASLRKAAIKVGVFLIIVLVIILYVTLK